MDKRDEKDGENPRWCCNVNQRGGLSETNATAAELRFAWSGRLLVDASRTMSCLVNVVTRLDDRVSASCLQRLVIKNVAGIVGSVETIGADQRDAGAVAWAVAIAADDANDALAGTAMRWHAVVQGSEVGH